MQTDQPARLVKSLGAECLTSCLSTEIKYVSLKILGAEPDLSVKRVFGKDRPWSPLLAVSLDQWEFRTFNLHLTPLHTKRCFHLTDVQLFYFFNPVFVSLWTLAGSALENDLNVWCAFLRMLLWQVLFSCDGLLWNVVCDQDFPWFPFRRHNIFCCRLEKGFTFKLSFLFVCVLVWLFNTVPHLSYFRGTKDSTVLSLQKSNYVNFLKWHHYNH